MQDKLIEAVAVAYNKAKCAHDQKACMGGIEAAIAAVRAHDAQQDAEDPAEPVEDVHPITQLAMSLQWEDLYTDEYKRRVLKEAIAAALVDRRTK